MTTLKSGLFIVLYDEKTLKLYLKHGIYGFLMDPNNYDKPRSKHYNALADYACTREGTHVYFFLKRKIYYGGQIVGNKDKGSFILNGQNSQLGLKHNSPLVWNEAKRYEPEEENNGIFRVIKDDQRLIRCQPYLLKFDDLLNQKGKYISSDDLYFKLGKYPLPLPSNSMAGMGFCTLTPKETEITLDLVTNSQNRLDIDNNEDITIDYENLSLFNGELTVDSIGDATNLINEAQIEAFLLANPEFLPESIRPKSEDILCRQVPISPFKPENMDRADICIFKPERIMEGLIPNVIIELKKRRGTKDVIAQVTRYLKWLEILLEDSPKEFQKIKAYVLAPSFNNNIKSFIEDKYSEQIILMNYFGQEF